NLRRQGILGRCGKGEARNCSGFSAAGTKTRHGFSGIVTGSQGEAAQDFETVNLVTWPASFDNHKCWVILYSIGSAVNTGCGTRKVGFVKKELFRGFLGQQWSTLCNAIQDPKS